MYLLGLFLLIIIIIIVVAYIFNPDFNNWSGNFIGLLILYFVVVVILGLISSVYFNNGKYWVQIKYNTKDWVQKKWVNPSLY